MNRQDAKADDNFFLGALAVNLASWRLAFSMAKSKLGIYIIGLGSLDAVNWFAKAQPRIAVSMDHNSEKWREIKRVSPNTFIVGRYYLDDGEQKFDDPERDAEKFLGRMKSDAEKMRGIYSAWMGYNESVVQTSAEAERLSQFHVRWGDLMRAEGLKSCAYSFATGNPKLNLWPSLADGLRHCDYLSLHEYAAPTMNAGQGWLCLRYHKVIESLPADARRPVIITECGIDGEVVGRGQEGWRKFTDEAGYLRSLQWYDAEIRKGDDVLGAAIFAADAWGKNGSFGIANANLIRDYIGQGADDGRQTIDKAIALVKQFEGLYEKPYRDVNGAWIIGYGHTIGPDEHFIRITREEAVGLLCNDMTRYADAVTRNVRVPLNNNQYCALVSFCYNVGIGAFRSSELLIKLNKGDCAGAADELLRWKYAKGKVLPGLVRRRQAERALFLK